MQQICLEDEQASRLQTFLLMTTRYREQEVESWETLAQERDDGGAVKFPNASGNADFWKETITIISAVIEAINRSETV